MSAIIKKVLAKTLTIISGAIMIGFTNTATAQSPCMATVPSYTVDLTGNPAGIWTSPNVSRDDQCCSATSPDQCIYFNLTLDPNTAGIQIDMIGADPAGSLFYDIGCTGSYPGGQIKCISGVGPHQITFCKPGGNKNIYKITSISKPMFPNDDTVRIGCRKKLNTLGIVSNTTVWQSIFPGAPGQYNSYLDSTNVASPTYTPASDAPAYVDYRVCGFPQASGCGFNFTVCDTVRIYNYPVLNASINPSPATFCNIGLGSGVTVTGTASGGLPAYTYTWFNSSNVQVGTGTTYFANAAGTYSVQIKDKLYNALTCPAFYTSVSVTQGTVPIVDAGANKKVCASNPTTTLNGSVQFADGGIWSGGQGTYNPGNTYLTTSYTPTAAEITAKFVKLYLTSSGAGGGCVNKIDSTIIYFSPVLSVTIPAVTLPCFNSTTTIDTDTTGGTAPITYTWNTGATSPSITGGEGAYVVDIIDSVGCTASANLYLTAPTPLSLSFLSVDANPNGASNGSATVTTSGGTTPYSIIWNPTGLTTPTISSLPYGVYTANIVDANGCSISGSTVVNEPRCLGFSLSTTSTNVTCYADKDGTASVTPVGGTAGYTYLWNTSPVSISSNVSSLDAGVYSVQVTDGAGCIQTANVEITEPTALTNAMTHNDVTTIGGNNGDATANPFGGIIPYNFNWSNSATTASISNLIAGTYSVDITDDNGCIKSDAVTITQPPCNNLTLNVIKNDVLCYGSNNGNAIAIIGGATGLSQINWSNGATSPSISGLAAGNYSVTILDEKKCTESFNFTITQPSQLSVGLSPTDISCFNATDGTIELTISGGNYPYTFSWSNGSTSEDLAYLPEGLYSVNVIDSKGCSASSSATVNEPAQITTSYTAQNVSCLNGTNGSIDLTVNGGVIPYTYTWSNGASTQDINGLVAGGYSLGLIDANNCSIGDPILVAINQPDSVKVDSFIVACSVPSSGQTQVTVIPTGGYSGTFQVSFDNGLTYNSAGVYTAMLNNNTTYQVILKDGNNCTSLLADNLSIGTEVKIDSITYNKCYAIGTTTIPVQVYPSGGAGAPYSVSFTNGASYLAAGTYTDNLPIASSYSVVIKDNKGCVSSIQAITLPAIFNSTVVITSNFNGQHISCNGSSDGAVLATATGGTTPHSYSWNSTPTQSTASANGLAAGNYTVTINDANNCIITNTVTLIQPSAVTATTAVTSDFNGQHISCNGFTDGQATATPNGGTSPYTYSWNTVPSQTTDVATNLAAGTYSVIVKDINNCAITTNVTLVQPTAITSTVTITSNFNGQHISCNNVTDGAVIASATGGTGAYSYSWNTTPAQLTDAATNLGAGTYIITINDINNCTITNTITLIQPSAVTATAIVSSNYNGQDISCNGLSDGEATVTPNGGTAPYTYSWNTTPAQTTTIANGLSASAYTVTITDINGCNTSANVTLTQPLELNVNLIDISLFNGFNVSCNGSNNGYLDIQVDGGTGVYSYNWSNTATSQDVSNLGAGTYEVIISDINGCLDSLETIITEPTPLIASIDSLSNYNGYNVSCNGLTDGNIYVSANGGVSTYTYTWSNNTNQQDLTNVGVGNYNLLVTDLNNCFVSLDTIVTSPEKITISNTYLNPLCYGLLTGSIDATISGGVTPYNCTWSNSATTEDLNALAAGTYELQLTDNNACKDSITVIINQPAVLGIAKTYDGLKCYGDSIGNINLNTFGGTLPYTFNWSNGSTNSSLNNISHGTYSVLIIDAHGCEYKDTTIITQPDSLTLVISSPTHQGGFNISLYNANDGAINTVVNGGTLPYSYIWSNGSNDANLSNLSSGLYYLTVIDTNGCKVSAEITLTQPLILEMPQGYSPNNDTKNDLFVIHGIEAYPNNTLTIYNRWGNIVYSKDGYLNEWDGNSNNGQELPTGTYFAILEVNNGEIVLKGYVELRR